MKKLLLLSFFLFVFGVATASGVRSMIQNEAYMPLTYAGASPTPTLEPTNTPEPSPTPEPTPTGVPGEEWLWVARAGNVGDEFLVYAVVPGIGYELEGNKVGKTVYITAYCPGGVTCTLEPIPPVFPPECEFWPGGRWCQIEKLIYDGSAKGACGTQYPYNCVHCGYTVL